MSLKSVETRVAECVEIRKQLFEVGLLAPAQLVDAMNAFVREGSSSSGKTFVPRAGRVLEWCLSTRQPSTAVLRR